MSKVLPMPVIFEAANKVLNRALLPLHYGELTERALNDLGYSRRDVDFSAQKADIREKMLIAGRYNTGYTPEPGCYAYKKSWFPQLQFSLLTSPDDCIVIKGSAQSGIQGAFETVMRLPHMFNKYGVGEEKRARMVATGLVIEHHVADWFAARWPKFYRHPENYRRWAEPCNHDFKLEIGSQTISMDVSGKNSNGAFGSNGNKKTTDIHLLCSIAESGNNVIWHGFVRGEKYKSEIVPEQAKTPVLLVVWLNCLHEQIDYKIFL